MRKVLSFITLAVMSFITMIVGQIQAHPVLLYAGVIFGGFLVLALVVYLLKLLWRVIGNSLTSILFLLASGIIIATMIYQGVINAIISFGVGIIIGLLLTLVLIRRLSNKAHTSMIFGELFTFITNYQVRAYVSKDRIKDKADREVETNDTANIILILKNQMGYSKSEAREAAEYAIVECPINAPIEDKIQTALAYHGKPDKTKSKYN